MEFTYTDKVLKHIDKLVGKLKDEKELVEVLKRKLTKKEIKVFKAIESNEEITKICADLRVDEERVKELYKTAIWKLNQEKIKKELISH